jgi:hypothetical protein
MSAAQPLPVVPHEAPPPLPPRRVHDEPPAPAWQDRAAAAVDRAEALLWSPAGARALEYLRQDRGLTDDSIRRWRLGYVADDAFDPPGAWGLPAGTKRIWLPRGILIPSEVHGDLYYVTVPRPVLDCAGRPDALARRLGVRPAGGVPKYVRPRGHTAALFGAGTLAARSIALDLEGELDVIVTVQQAGDLVGAVTMGGTTIPVGGRWLLALSGARRIIAIRDNDGAGAAAAAKLKSLSRRMRVASYPSTAKDATALHAGGGDLRGWVVSLVGDLCDA